MWNLAPINEPRPLAVRVLGLPASQGSKTPGAPVRTKTGRIFVPMREASKKKLDPWRMDVKHAFMRDGLPLRQFGAHAIMLQVEFIMTRPASHPKRGKTRPATKRPDLDKLTRAIKDAITSAGVYKDDSQVVEMHVRKRLAEEGEPTGCKIRLCALE